LTDDREVAQLPEMGEPAYAHFGPSRVLVLRGEKSLRLQLWDLGGAEPVLRFKDEHVHHCHFRPDGKLLALAHENGSISVYDLATGAWVHQLKELEIVRRAAVRLHPTEPFVAVFSYFHRPVQVRDLRTGAVVAQLMPPWHNQGTCAWSPDGRTLAVPQGDLGGKIQLLAFDPAAPARLDELRLLECPETKGGIGVCYNPAGDRLAAWGWSGVVHLFDPFTGQRLFSTHSLRAPPPGTYLRFDRTGQRLVAALRGEQRERIGLWSVADHREYRSLVHSGGGEAYGEPAIHRGGELAAIGLKNGVALFDIATGRELAHPAIRKDQTTVRFDGTGSLLTNGFEGFFRWPVRPNPGNPRRLFAGPPERLRFNPARGPIAASRDGRVIAQCMWSGYGEEAFAGGWILHPNAPTPRRVDAGQSTRLCSVSPDGRWVAFGGPYLGAGRAAINVYDRSVPLPTHAIVHLHDGPFFRRKRSLVGTLTRDV
jgi:WD40 repeat protein